MGSGTAVATIRPTAAVALGAACLFFVCVTASGCVLGNDNDRPVLAVDPLWDLSPGPRFLGGSCEKAGVDWMTWEIQDSRGRTLEKSTDLEPCKPLDFLDLTPGTYTVVLTGYDQDEQPRWNATHKGLRLSRFDVLYELEVDQVEDDTPSDPDDGDEDAGTAD